MTTRTHHTLQGRFRILAALGVTSLALLAASPANAIYRDYEAPSDETPVIERTINNTNETPPVDENGKKSCPYKKWDGGTGYYPHGTKITVTLPNGASKTMTCNDGEWEAAFVQPASDYHYEADEAYVDASGALVLVNQHEEYTYSTGGGYYAQP
jgi:hypothetical protein